MIIVERPFVFIESKMERREQFVMTVGRQPTYALLFIKEGRFALNIDGRSEIIGEGDCAIFSDDIDFFRSVIEPISFVYIKFRPNPKCPFTLPITSGKTVFRQPERFLENIRQYEAIMESTDGRHAYLREHLLEDIFWQIFLENGGSATEAVDRAAACHDATVAAAVAYIRAHVSEHLSIQVLCRALGTNPSTLNFKFRRELSSSVGAFITEERMRLAKRLLVGTSHTVGAIAAKCGYDNIYYFSTVFRRQHGESPSAFRQNNRR